MNLENKYLLHYTEPAKEWVEALPIGNGHMGAMVYGNGLYELTEATCWSGCVEETPLKPDADVYMEKARKFLLERRVAEAETLLSHCTGNKKNYGTQLPMGRLYVNVIGEEGVDEVKKRTLDLQYGIAEEIMESDSCTIKREAWISNPAKIMVLRVWSEKEIPSIGISLNGWSNPSKTEINVVKKHLRTDGIALENIHSDGLHGVSYCMKLQVQTDGMVTRTRDGLRVKETKEIILYLACACDLYGINAVSLVHERLEAALEMGYEKLLHQHKDDFCEKMKRCTLTLPGNKNSALPTDKRILAYREDRTDYALIALYFAYGRYLLLISSRADSILPAALQGILNDNRACRMEWTDDMHLDVNTQMNYYPAEPTGLGDSTYPLLRWIRDILMPEGEKIAKELYHADGWCAHTVSNAHGWAAPGWDVDWGFFISGGAWASVHIWEHWLYTNDYLFLEEYFHVLRGCAKFYHSILEEDEKSGKLVVNPSFSPENRYMLGQRHYCMTIGATADTALAKYLLEAVCEAAEILGEKGNEYDLYRQDIKKLPDWQIDKLGRLQEWLEPYEDAFPDHRHMCHLIALHPLGLIDVKKNPELERAVQRVMECRLGENAQDIILANWAGAMLILMHARLFQGELAGHFIEPMIAFLSRSNMLITHEGPTDSITGGIYELDGNTGLCAAITEMLLQNHRDRVDILPAIPKSWKSGEVTGLRIYGGHCCDISWNETQISLKVEAICDMCMDFSYDTQVQHVQLKKDNSKTIIFTRFNYNE